jgi:DNA-binding CsgD family transcriptional regulator
MEPRAVLSPREFQVLEMVALGLSNAQMAARLNVTIHAIKFHLAAVYRKLGVSNRTEAAVRYLQSGGLTSPPRDNAAVE